MDVGGDGGRKGQEEVIQTILLPSFKSETSEISLLLFGDKVSYRRVPRTFTAKIRRICRGRIYLEEG